MKKKYTALDVFLILIKIASILVAIYLSWVWVSPENVLYGFLSILLGIILGYAIYTVLSIIIEAIIGDKKK